MPNPGPDRPILIVGCARSGTTMMQLMLHAHPRMALPPETRYLLPVYDERLDFGDLTDPENHRKLAQAIVERPNGKFPDLGLDPERTIENILAGPPTIGSAFGVVFRDYAERFGKVRWGDKRPMFIRNLPEILRLFPDVQVIHMIRDGRDCVASLKKMPWWTRGSVMAMAMWTQSIDCGYAARRRLTTDSYIEVQYEKLVTDPRNELERLCRFLGEEFHEAMLEPSAVAADAVPERKTWHARTAEKVSDASSGRFRMDLEPWEIRLFEFVAGRRMVSLGYSLTGPRRLPSPKALARYLKAWAIRRRFIWAYRRADARRIARETQPVASRLTARQLELADRE